MVRVLVLGAAGYIGLEVAAALRRNGHKVFGVARKPEEVKLLKSLEIIPVIQDVSDPKDRDALARAIDGVNVVIDTVMNYTDKTPLQTNREIVQLVLTSSKKGVAGGGQKKRYIYTSGALVYGDHGKEVVDESFPPKAAVPRVAFEKELVTLSSKELDVTVARPVWVYGGARGKYTLDWWSGNEKGEIVVDGKAENYWSWISIWDLADAFVRLTEAPSAVVAGEVFDIADDTRLTYEEWRVAMARAHGVKGPVVHAPAKPDRFSQTADISLIVGATKIRKALGWQPRAGTFIDNVQAWHDAVEAAGAFEKKGN